MTMCPETGALRLPCRNVPSRHILFLPRVTWKPDFHIQVKRFLVLLLLTFVMCLTVCRVSPSDADSTVSEDSSERDAGEKTPAAAPKAKAHRAAPSGLCPSPFPAIGHCPCEVPMCWVFFMCEPFLQIVCDTG